MSFPDIVPDLKAAMPDLKGRLAANVRLGDITWFRVGGPSQVLFTPADETVLMVVRVPCSASSTMVSASLHSIAVPVASSVAVSGLASPPAAGTVWTMPASESWMSAAPRNAMVLPSGDQARSPSLPAVLVSGLGWVPSSVIV